MRVNIKLFDEKYMPIFKHEIDACCDCRARLDEPITIEPKQRRLIPLGFAIEIPIFYEGQLRPRSGGSKDSHDICLGTIDPGYTGEVSANYVNNGEEPVVIKDGDRICQLAIREAPPIDFVRVESLSESARGSDGFGSTGIK